MTSEVTATNYKKLQSISAFLKGEEFYHLVADFPKKTCSMGRLQRGTSIFRGGFGFFWVT
jgi:hypothetical protein